MNPYFKIVFFAFLIELATSLLRFIDFRLCSVVTFIILFIFQYIISKRYENRLKAECLCVFSVIGCALLQVPARIIQPDTLVSLPDFLFHLLGIVMGYLFYKSNSIFRIMILILSLLSCLFLSLRGYDLWLHKVNFNTYTGKIESVPTPDFQFSGEQGEILTKNNFVGKYTVLDFWNTGCGICFRKFPIVQELYVYYIDSPSVSVLSINVRLRNEPDGFAFNTVKERGYSFPVFRMERDDPALVQLNIQAYPTVLILDPELNLVFRGDIENVKRYLDEHLL